VGRLDTDRYVTVDDTRAVNGLCEHKCTTISNIKMIPGGWVKTTLYYGVRC